jgi:hypothetical protein
VTFTYRLLRDGGAIVAECVEVDCAASGATEDEAVASLKDALAERMLRPEAVAPPPSGPSARIDLVRAA